MSGSVLPGGVKSVANRWKMPSTSCAARFRTVKIIDADDRKVLAQWAILVLTAIVVLIVAAGALGFALSVFEAARRL